MYGAQWLNMPMTDHVPAPKSLCSKIFKHYFVEQYHFYGFINTKGDLSLPPSYFPQSRQQKPVVYI